MDIQSYFNKQSAKIDSALDKFLPSEKELPVKLHRAMRYAVFSGGKRIRPILTLAACQAVGGNPKEAMPAACAIELIHNYSLVHDDLPCMDDDNVRRGRPTCHKKFGEVTALLAGDALLTLAFGVLSSSNGYHDAKGAQRRLLAARMVAEAVGTRGMVGGQAVDIEFQNKEVDLPTIEYINTHKSGALIVASLKVGALLGGGTQKQIKALTQYGRYVGLVFQIVDDILDREGYAKVIGRPEAIKEAKSLVEKAKTQIRIFGSKGVFLHKIADFILMRNH